jgi:hypothetical protein
MLSPLPNPAKVIRSGKGGRLCFTPAQRGAMLDAFERCGVSAMSFARQHGLKYQTFISWLRKRREERERQVDDGGGFAEVVLGPPSDPGPGAPGLRVELPGGAILYVTSRAALPLAAELLNSLRRSC